LAPLFYGVRAVCTVGVELPPDFDELSRVAAVFFFLRFELVLDLNRHKATALVRPRGRVVEGRSFLGLGSKRGTLCAWTPNLNGFDGLC
jgi:hypothetical protein